MDTDSRDTIIRELREENASLMAQVQSLGDREAALKAMVETLMAQTRELQARLDSAGETIARLRGWCSAAAPRGSSSPRAARLSFPASRG